MRAAGGERRCSAALKADSAAEGRERGDVKMSVHSPNSHSSNAVRRTQGSACDQIAALLLVRSLLPEGRRREEGDLKGAEARRCSSLLLCPLLLLSHPTPPVLVNAGHRMVLSRLLVVVAVVEMQGREQLLAEGPLRCCFVASSLARSILSLLAP